MVDRDEPVRRVEVVAAADLRQRRRRVGVEQLPAECA